ncbi:MucR family transcriptional regulator [Sphingomonas sp. KR1UV-12]|uniref:MucR family transcriptional regulator n=1 Tax=Sphingomonas aurea TaxID=3063994 RepID=A0ABT9EJI8_9SPHN|nr:MucR family transcriptional regulator [Sphingomonas sp. KR1UV-12]MDP1027005.1 MucR family transcriptional regulator [Sphingomonas sp. KR1UV-12]
MTETDNKPDLVMLAAELTAAWLANPNNRVNGDDVPAFLIKMYETVQQLSGTSQAIAEPVGGPEYTPAVSVRKSLASPDHIVSMIDGKTYKTLKRHLSTNGLTPDEYRERYGLKADYPMVAQAYGEARRAMAVKIGLGRKPRAATPEEAPAQAPTKTPQKRKAAEPVA